MANTSFRIALASVTTEPSEPPLLAWPTTNEDAGGSVVIYPRPTRRDGNGAPVGVIGRPFAKIGRHKIGVTGLAYYNALFTGATGWGNYVKVKLYDPRTTSWQVYGGIAWRPEQGAPRPGAAYSFQAFSLTVTELQLLSGWGVTYPSLTGS